MFFDLKSFAEMPALFMENEVWAYSKLFDTSEKIAGLIPTRSLVFLVCSNTPVSIAEYVGFINHGIVPVMIDKELDEELFHSLLEQYSPAYIFAEEAHFDFLDRYMQTLHIEGSVLYDTGEQQSYPLHEALALLMTTSGSTGSPKLVRPSYDNLKANTESIVKYLDLHEDERAVTNLPLHYVYGRSILNTHLSVVASVVWT